MRAVLVGALLAVVLALAGCGGSGGGATSTSGGNGEASKSPDQALADAVSAAVGASSVHVSGEMGGGTFDMSITKSDGATGSATLGGSKVSVVIVGGGVYLRAGASFWTQFLGTNGAAFAPMVANRWVKVPTTNPQVQQIAGLGDSTTFFKSVTASHGALTNKGETTYQGQSVVAINDASKSATLYIAAEGTPYPVALARGGAGGGALSFNDWNQSVTVAAPAGALDLSHVTG